MNYKNDNLLFIYPVRVPYFNATPGNIPYKSSTHMLNYHFDIRNTPALLKNKKDLEQAFYFF